MRDLLSIFRSLNIRPKPTIDTNDMSHPENWEVGDTVLFEGDHYIFQSHEAPYVMISLDGEVISAHTSNVIWISK